MEHTEYKLPEKLKELNPDDVNNEPLLEYVRYATSIFAPQVTPLCRFDIETHESYIIQSFPDGIAGCYVFVKRYFEGKIEKTSCLDKYISNESIMGGLEAWGLDPIKFWFLILWAQDYVQDWRKGIVLGTSHKEELEKFVNRFEELGFVDDGLMYYKKNQKKGKLILKVDGRQSLTIQNPDTLFFILTAVKRLIALEGNNEDDKQIKRRIESFSMDTFSDAGNIPNSYMFAKFYDCFPAVMDKFKQEKKTIYNKPTKYKMVSMIIYVIYSDIRRFLDDDTYLKNLIAKLERKYDNTIMTIYGK